MRVVFAGTPRFAVPALERLVQSGFDVCAVYTQPDRPSGRGRRPKAGPVKLTAERHALPVRQPVSLSSDEAVAELGALHPDIMVVVAYGLLLPPAVLAVPPFGCVNVHASLLPRWRGAAPIARAIEAGDTATGVTLMKMDRGLDTGPILAAREVGISLQDDAATLHDKLARVGADLLVETLPKYLKGDIRPEPQRDADATYAPKLVKSEGRIDWSRPAQAIFNQIRAFNPWPGAHTFHGDQRIRILRAAPGGDPGRRALAPGTIREVDHTAVEVVCGEGALRLLRLQRDGGKPLPAREFVNGYPLESGERLR